MSIRATMNIVIEEIKRLENVKEELQNFCNHKETEEVDYMWRPGAIERVVKCKECDKIINSIAGQYIEMTITTSD